MGSLRLGGIGLGLIMLLAGCTGEPTTEVGTASRATGEDGMAPAVIRDDVASQTLDEAAATAADVPLWRVGDAWSVTTHGGDDGEERSSLVVTRAEGDNYLLETTSEQMASFDAMFDVSYLGNIRARDLAGSQQGNAVQYFAFPLTDGKTWTTSWDGYEVALTATKGARGFDIVGTVEGERYVEYDFVPDLRWWSKLEFVRDGYGIRVERAETGWTGELAAATAKLLYDGAPAAPVASPNSGAFTVDEGQTTVIASHRGDGAQYVTNVVFFDPANSPHTGTFTAQAMGPDPIFATYELPPTPGEWHVSAPAVHDPTGGFWLTVHQVAVAKKTFA